MGSTQKAMPRAIAPQGRGGIANNKVGGNGGYSVGYSGKHTTSHVKAPAPAFTSKGPVRIPPPEQQHNITREFGNDPMGGTSGQGDTTSALGT